MAQNISDWNCLLENLQAVTDLAPLLPDWEDRDCRLNIVIQAQDPRTARRSFLDRFYELSRP
jgi:hypothetical protein